MSKHIPFRAGGLLIALVLLAAASAHGSATALGNPAQTDSAYCGSLSTRADRLKQRIESKNRGLQEQWRQQSDTLAVLSSSQSGKVQELRSSVDAERSANISALRDKAKTEQQATAVDAYAAALAGAVQARREAVDSARTSFLVNLKDIVRTRQAAASGHVQALQITALDAYAMAENSCQDAIPVSTVRMTLAQNLAAAKQTFVASQMNDKDSQAQIQLLIATRKAAVKTANESFLTTTSQARQQLKAALAEAD